MVVRQSKYYRFGYGCIVTAMLLKMIVVASLLIGAWNYVGLCYIPYTFKIIIAITNSIEVVCLLVNYVLIYRIKAVNREILIEKLMTTKTFAES